MKIVFPIVCLTCLLLSPSCRALHAESIPRQCPLPEHEPRTVMVRLREDDHRRILFETHKSSKQRLEVMVSRLIQHATRAQSALRQYLAKEQNISSGVSVESFWIRNEVRLKNVSEAVLRALAALPIVEAIRDEIQAYLDPIMSTRPNSNVTCPPVLPFRPWSFDLLDLETLRGRNVTGEGVLVGMIDSGVSDHVDLRPNFHSGIGWFDAVENRPRRNDPAGHGTQVLGKHSIMLVSEKDSS